MAAAIHSPDARTGLFPPRHRLHVLLVDADAGRREQLATWLGDACEVHAAADAAAALALALEVVPGLLVADAGTTGVECLIERMHEELAVFDFGVLLLLDAEVPPPADGSLVVLRRPFSREQLLARVADASAPQRAPASALRDEQHRREEAEALLGLALELTARHDLQALLQRATDVATRLTGASLGVFVPKSDSRPGHRPVPLALSGGLPATFDGDDSEFTGLGETLASARVVRCDDLQCDPPTTLLPSSFAPMRSYMAVPVVSRGKVLGGLFFGHARPAAFSRRAEHVASAIAAQVAIALDNARLLGALQQEVARRKRIERALPRGAV